eukprot:766411-Hanusia_phi.AAC.2
MSRNINQRIHQFCEIFVFEGNAMAAQVSGADPRLSSPTSSSWRGFLEVFDNSFRTFHTERAGRGRGLQ